MERDRLDLRIPPEQRERLAKLAQVYKMPMTRVLLELVEQAYHEYVESGEVMALLKDHRTPELN